MRFYLGTHHASWLGRTDVPLFVSRRRLAGIRRLPRALGPWALDSGGFTELSMFGRWRTTAAQYVDARHSGHMFRTGVNYHFNWGGPVRASY